MTVKDNVLRLWKAYRPDIKSVAELERKIDISNGIISQWEKSTPSTKSAKKVADFFGVPVSSVLNDSTDDSVELKQSEQQLIAAFRKNTDGMTDDEKAKFSSSLDILMRTAKDLLKDDK
ncbi:helix-turn-helix transcriptional regulator [Lactobacillus sp. LC28-10]|uniref:Helix-turn-helix transcriptional regulator n=1 Tax=Secundilactobacillus angelensis TaxID=2722706 RepID=A0ABX1L1W6_9LACO|nr:helix-turn-helix transcriptional regulator [Secundilactobacillus angelensis]MCH5463313.1 helix-turn-helix domain-containing protein [Secundilactobacillus angelensis]NLR19203.1 helix-turn-helix transcriptional regulator [Secundilactobacillus angelensis]